MSSSASEAEPGPLAPLSDWRAFATMKNAFSGEIDRFGTFRMPQTSFGGRRKPFPTTPATTSGEHHIAQDQGTHEGRS
jgi:hypothetical protein